MLKRFRPSYFLPSHCPASTPGKHTVPVYRKIQLAKVGISRLRSPTERTEIQAIVGPLLYYARAVDPTLLPIANEIASNQASPTQNIMAVANRALSYPAVHMHTLALYCYSSTAVQLAVQFCCCFGQLKK
jgi:hypothetical protein